MPKKFDGENSKVTAARARKEKTKVEERQKKVAAEEEEFWRDDDKHVQKKLQRKDEKEKKREEQLAKKAQLKTLADEELASIKEAKQASSKLTRVQIQAEVEKREAAARGGGAASQKVAKTADAPIPENINRVQLEGAVARTIDEAIQVLRLEDSDASEAERHPEKRMKAAYAAFEEKHLPTLRKENPNMRLSQIKQMLHREWLRSPENPLNSTHVRYNQ